MAQAPALVRLSNSVARPLIGRFQLGPNGLLTVRGRKSGLPRTVPVAVMDVDGRRWLLGAYGDVHWVRNLRAAGEGEIRLGGRTQRVTAVELSIDEATAYFREVLIPYVRRQPRLIQLFARPLLGPILADPAAAAHVRPVFELHDKAA